MSNNYPTISEVAQLVYKLNMDFDAHVYNTTGKDDISCLFELITNGDEMNVTCAGSYVWNSTDDMREILYEEANPCEPLYEINEEEKKESLESYLIKEFNKIKMCLLSFKMQGEL